MRLVRFLKRSFLDGSLYEVGDEALVGDNHFGAHMVDVASGQADDVPPAAPEHQPHFIDHSGDTPHPSGVGIVQAEPKG